MLLARIRGEKAVILDSCFSGTGTRDITMHTMNKGLPSSDQLAIAKTPEAGSGFGDVLKAGTDHVLIASCQDNQVCRVMTRKLDDR